MFFPERIKKILPADKVLEIGPGAAPHSRANVFLEKKFDKEEALVQSGYSAPAALTKQIIYYDGKKFPFEDHAFDYVICSHVIEHVPLEDLAMFISEIQRISKKGYIEFPTVFYELINYEPVHIWLMNFRNGKMLFMDKRLFESSNIHKIIRSMFYGNDTYLRKLFSRYKELFFVGYEWENTIDFETVSDFNVLVNEADLKQWETFFRTYIPPMAPPVIKSPLYRRACYKIKRFFSSY